MKSGRRLPLVKTCAVTILPSHGIGSSMTMMLMIAGCEQEGREIEANNDTRTHVSHRDRNDVIDLSVEDYAARPS